MRNPKRGDIYLVNFDPTQGAEIKKTRPALVLQTDIINSRDSNRTTIIAPFTSNIRQKQTRVAKILIPARSGNGLTQDSVVVLTQLRTADYTRFVKRLGKLTDKEMTQVDESIGIVMGLKLL